MAVETEDEVASEDEPRSKPWVRWVLFGVLTLMAAPTMLIVVVALYQTFL